MSQPGAGGGTGQGLANPAVGLRFPLHVYLQMISDLLQSTMRNNSVIISARPDRAAVVG